MTSAPTLEAFRELFLGTCEARSAEIESADVEAAALGIYLLTVPVGHGGFGLELPEYLP